MNTTTVQTYWKDTEELKDTVQQWSDRIQFRGNREQAQGTGKTQFILSNKNGSHFPSPNQPKQSDKPLWEIADDIIATIPEKSFDLLPNNAAANLDHYLYGTPQK